MNKKQRDKNRRTARWLKNQMPCPRCGKRGNHRFPGIFTYADKLTGKVPEEWWSCVRDGV